MKRSFLVERKSTFFIIILYRHVRRCVYTGLCIITEASWTILYSRNITHTYIELQDAILYTFIISDLQITLFLFPFCVFLWTSGPTPSLYYMTTTSIVLLSNGLQYGQTVVYNPPARSSSVHYRLSRNA